MPKALMFDAISDIDEALIDTCLNEDPGKAFSGNKNEERHNRPLWRRIALACAIPAVAALLILILPKILDILFSACTNKQRTEYISYICDMANDGVLSKIEVDYWTGGSWKDETAPEAKTVEFMGTEYNLYYDSSWRPPFSPVEVMEYHTIDNTATIWISAGTRKITYFHSETWVSEIEEYLKNQITLQEARTIADRFAEQYIYLDEYQISETAQSDLYNEKEIFYNYHFEYAKYVGGLPTSDRLSIVLSNSGKIISAGWTNVGLFHEKKDITIDKKSLDDSIQDALKRCYGKEYDYSCQYDKQQLTYTPENKMAVVSSLRLKLKHKTSGIEFDSGVIICTIIPDSANTMRFDINNHETWFDDSEKHIVPLKDAESIKEGMSFAEVVKFIGKPREDVGSGAFVMKWEVESEKVLLITFNPAGTQKSEGDLYAYMIILE